MFVVSANILIGGYQKIFAEGDTPHEAWENLLSEQEVVAWDLENVRFFEMVSPDRVSMVTTTKWVLDSDE